MNNKFKSNVLFTIGIIGMALGLTWLLAGCTAGSNPDVNGSWTYSEDGVSFEATVTAGTIEMMVDFDGSAGLYWAGTFPETIDDGAVVVSDANTAALSTSLYGSLDGTKDFTYEGGELLFDFTMMGVTKRVNLVRE